MNFQDFVDENVAKKSKNGVITVTSEINKRWETRIVAQGLDKMGVDGVQAYLARYGKNIAAPKVIALALCADAKGANQMATAFWVKAYELTFGEMPSDMDELVTAQITSTSPKVDELPVVPDLPDNLQPGRIHTMQPVDAPKEREHYINDPSYWGQPKRDGHRTVVIATPEKVYFQTRNLNLITIDNVALVEFLADIAKRVGTYVLDGELWYRSFDGKEHRTAAQAAEWGVNHGEPMASVATMYTAFKILFFQGESLLDEPESHRILTLQQLVWNGDFFEKCPTAVNTEEKRSLVKKQILEGREGEIWVDHACRYIGGKHKDGLSMVRTKYLQTGVFICTGCTPTTAENRLFGALEICEEDGDKLVSVGKVGTGFNLSDQQEMMEYFKYDINFTIAVEYQGRTASGKLMHARYQGIDNG